MTAMSQQPCKRSSPNSDRCFESGARTRDAHLRSLDDTAQADERAGSGAQYGPEPKLGDAAVNAPDQDPPPVLRLLVRAKRDVGPNAKTLQISGVTWAIAEYADVGARTSRRSPASRTRGVRAGHETRSVAGAQPLIAPCQ
jgi:hypothetical protein